MALELKGPLTADSLEEVLGVLAEGLGAYSFLVSDGVSEKIFYFAIGGMRMLNLGRSRSQLIGDMLVSRKKLNSPDRDRVLEHARKSQKSFGQAATDLKLVDRADVEAMVREQLEGEVCDLFYWTEAEFEFREGQPPEQFYEARHSATSLSIDVPSFVTAVRQRLERWKSVTNPVTSDAEVPHITEAGRARCLKEGESTLTEFLRYCDGERRIREILSVSGLSSLDVYESLYVALKDGLLLRIGDRGEGLVADHEAILEEIRKLEKSRTEMMGDLIIRSRLAKAYERIHENAKAAAVWREIASIHRRRSNLGQVLQALKKAVKCTPEDFKTREQILEVYRSMGDIGKYIEQGQELAESLFKSNLLNRARNLLGSLVNVAPNNPRTRKLYALTLLGLGHRDEALSELKKLAKILEDSGASSSELKEVYRRILALDKTNRLYRQKLIKLIGSRRSVWGLRAGIVATILVLLFGGGSFAYELLARKTYSNHTLEIQRLISDNNFELARSRIRQFQRDYPLSSISRRATDFLGRIDAVEARYLRSGLKADLREAAIAEGAGEYEKALAIYQRIGQLDPSKDGQVEEAQKRALRLESADQEADRLLAEADRHTKAGEFEDAVRIYRELRSLYPMTRQAESITFPARISSLPPGARVFLNGVEMSSSSAGAVIYYSLATRQRLRLELDGFEPIVHEIEDVLDAETNFNLRKNTRWVFEAEGPFEASPVISGDTLFIAGRDRRLYALSKEDGSVRYTVPLGIFGDSSSTVAVIRDTVVVGTSRGEVLAVRAGDGRRLWSSEVADSVNAEVTVSGDGTTVLVNDAGGRVTALDVGTGTVRWSTHVSAAPGSAPVVRGDQVLVGSYTLRRVTVLSLNDGAQMQILNLGCAIATTPAIESGFVCVGSDDFTVQALQIETGESIGTFCTNGTVIARPVFDHGAVYVGSTDGEMYAYRMIGGLKPLWVRRLGRPILGAAALTRERVFVGSTNGAMFCMDRKDGKILWRFQTDGEIVSQPLVEDGTLYVSSTDGKIYAIDL
jgi:eukaryotic-like serine/threonine-protein kinase